MSSADPLIRTEVASDPLTKQAGSAPGALLAVEKEEARHDEEMALQNAVEDRLCAICLSNPVEVMLIPCRHAVLCQECAKEVRERAAGHGLCPLCRTQVAGVVVGRFAEDFVRMLTEAERRLDWAQASMYEGMYNNVRYLIAVGALSGAGAVVCFVILPLPLAIMPGCALGCASFLLGYVPWFLTTAAAFEGQDEAVRERPRFLDLFSWEDLSRPAVLLTKTTTVAIGFPVAAVTFFLPYFGYKMLLRPLAGLLLHLILRGTCCVVAYGVLPAGRATCCCLQWTGQALWQVGQATVAAARWVREQVWRSVRAMIDAITTTAHLTWKHVMVPIGHAADVTFEATKRVATTTAKLGSEYIVKPTKRGVTSAAESVYASVLVPVGHALRVSFGALRTGVVTCASATYSYVIEPIIGGLAYCMKATGHGLKVAAEFICKTSYEYVLVPTGRCLCWVIGNTFKGLFYGMCLFGKGLVFTYQNVVVPVGGVIGDFATKVYVFVLLPFGRGIRAVGQAITGAFQAVVHGIVTGIATGAQAVYAYVLVPVGNAVVYTATIIGSAVASGARAVYANVLVPARNAIVYTVTTTKSAVVSGAQAVYAHVLAPVGNAVVYTATTIGSAVAAGAALVYENALAPTGRAIAAVASAVGNGARAVAQMVSSLFLSMAEGISLAAGHVFEAARAAADSMRQVFETSVIPATRAAAETVAASMNVAREAAVSVAQVIRSTP